MMRRHSCTNALLMIGLLIASVRAFAGQRIEDSHDCVTISRDTTYITEPLDGDGLPDYVAALNRRFGEGVTSDNNAVVILLEAWGPAEVCRGLTKEDQEHYIRMLGLSSLPQAGAYFINLLDYIKDHPEGKTYANAAPGDNPLWKQSSAAEKRPWSKEDCPIIADWLAANDKPLALLVEASKRPRYFDPIMLRHREQLTDMPGGWFSPVPYWGWLRGHSIVEPLAMRAMGQLYDEKAGEAWNSLLACHRFARLLAQGPASDDVRSANFIEYRTLLCDRSLLNKGRLTVDQVTKIREDLDRLPPLAKNADKFDLGERYLCLCWALRSRCDGLRLLKETLAERSSSRSDTADAAKAALNIVGAEKPDWNLVLRTINSCFDRIVEAQRAPTGLERKEGIERFNRDLLAEAEAPYDSAVHSKDLYSKRIALAFVFIVALEEDADFTVGEDRIAMELELIRLAFALAQYQADCGVYPARLSQLIPTYISTVPKDIFNNEDLHYKCEGDGYLLYSVGGNGRDDGGRTMQEGLTAGRAMEWDDLVVRIPVVAQ